MVEKVTIAQLRKKVDGLENEIDSLRAAMAELTKAMSEMATELEDEVEETTTPPVKTLTFAPEQTRGLPPLYG